jgi:hypothetical protein
MRLAEKLDWKGLRKRVKFISNMQNRILHCDETRILFKLVSFKFFYNIQRKNCSLHLAVRKLDQLQDAKLAFVFRKT